MGRRQSGVGEMPAGRLSQWELRAHPPGGPGAWGAHSAAKGQEARSGQGSWGR